MTRRCAQCGAPLALEFIDCPYCAETPPSSQKSPVQSQPAAPLCEQHCVVCGNSLATDGTCPVCTEAKRARDECVLRMRLGEKPENLIHNAPTFYWHNLKPLALCILGFGWGVPLLVLSHWNNGGQADITKNAVGITAILAVPALIFAVIAVLKFIRPLAVGIIDGAVQAFVFTGLVGVSLLSLLQPYLMALSLKPVTPHGGPFVAFFVGLGKLIGWSYLNLDNPNASLSQKFLANLMAPGFCEELTKLGVIIIIAIHLGTRVSNSAAWYKGILFVGFCSGIGFGVAEAISPAYAAWGNLPYFGWQVLRWFSGVPLHGLWGMCDAAIFCIFIHKAGRVSEKYQIYPFVLAIIAMGLFHGLFDFAASIHILLMPLVALASLWMTVWIVNKGAVAAGSFGNSTEPVEVSDSLQTADDFLDSGKLPFGRVYAISLVVIAAAFAWNSTGGSTPPTAIADDRRPSGISAPPAAEPMPSESAPSAPNYNNPSPGYNDPLTRSAPPAPVIPTEIGCTVEPLSASNATAIGVPSGNGVFIVAVDANSPAADAGLRGADTILSANGNMLSSSYTLEDAKAGRIDNATLFL